MAGANYYIHNILRINYIIIESSHDSMSLPTNRSGVSLTGGLFRESILQGDPEVVFFFSDPQVPSYSTDIAMKTLEEELSGKFGRSIKKEDVSPREVEGGEGFVGKIRF